MTIDEQIAILEAYKAGKRIRWESSELKVGGSFDIGYGDGRNTMPFDFQHNKYTIAPSFILVNGVEVPEPCRVMPKIREKYFMPTFDSSACVRSEVVTSNEAASFDVRIINSGLMHLTEAAARQHYEALILPSKQK
jgi:hypothetical protein